MDGMTTHSFPMEQKRSAGNFFRIGLCILSSTSLVLGQQSPASPDAATSSFIGSLAGYFPPPIQTLPLYEGAAPNSIAGPDQEKSTENLGMTSITKVSRPTLTVYRPAPKKSRRAAIVVLPGGGYTGLSWNLEGTMTAQALQDHGITAVILKYRLPSDQTMNDKSIGPLQDAQQALRVVRQHAKEWDIDPGKVGVMGFSAGGHLAATVGTHFDKSYVPNDDGANLRPDFLILVYPVISMKTGLTHAGSRNALLGATPAADKVELFSNETQVTDRTPPTLLLHASDDLLVDVDNSVAFYQALHHHNVPAQMVLFTKGNHGFFEIPSEQWRQPMWSWLAANGWMNP
jgi:acetyl esterase/lipase